MNILIAIISKDLGLQNYTIAQQVSSYVLFIFKNIHSFNKYEVAFVFT